MPINSNLYQLIILQKKSISNLFNANHLLFILITLQSNQFSIFLCQSIFKQFFIFIHIFNVNNIVLYLFFSIT